jgi:N-acetylglutamate synthase-like GNAT family acetyltransferase
VVGVGGLAPQNARSAELCKLHVDPGWQRQGVGRLIAIELVERARRAGFREVELHVTATQTAAIALYCSLGFREMSRKLFTTVVFWCSSVFRHDVQDSHTLTKHTRDLRGAFLFAFMRAR